MVTSALPHGITERTENLRMPYVLRSGKAWSSLAAIGFDKYHALQSQLSITTALAAIPHHGGRRGLYVWKPLTSPIG